LIYSKYSVNFIVIGYFVAVLSGLYNARCNALPPETVRPLSRSREFTNSIGMKFVRIEPGCFMMGQRQGGDWDERPVHKVHITKPFYISVTEVTNAQYEQYDPWHRHLRGRRGLSNDGDEAVIFVSWEDAMAFCRWLGKKEGRHYRLPTEAEWEYTCRAGTTSEFYTGQTWPANFHKNQRRVKAPKPVALHVGKTQPNAWGLYDMHGNVEEWCYDWYGPYPQTEQFDPVGLAEGDFRVCRGGSHNTALRYLRSANRMGTLPQDRHWLIGFRVVLGDLPATKPLARRARPLWARDVRQQKYDWSKGPDPNEPYFVGPLNYVKVPPKSNGPVFSKHNHDPGFTWCDNGDLLAIWYSCNSERGRELCVLASRLRAGAKQWEPAAPFWDAPDRNDHAPALLRDKQGRLYHFNGLSVGASYRENLALIMRTSDDNGASWSKARLINPVRGLPNQPIASAFCDSNGFLYLPCDWPWHRAGRGTGLWISKNRGRSWELAAGRIAGIHAGVVDLGDGRLLALGRHSNIDNQMPKSISADMGRTWTYEPSGLPPIGGGQRLVLRRLKEGCLFLASFAKEMKILDAAGRSRKVNGLFAALSYDNGRTWPVRRLITDDRPRHDAYTMDGRRFSMSPTSAEPRGYLAGLQTPDGIIHLISSWNYYAFNLAWLKKPMPFERSN